MWPWAIFGGVGVVTAGVLVARRWVAARRPYPVKHVVRLLPTPEKGGSGRASASAGDMASATPHVVLYENGRRRQYRCLEDVPDPIAFQVRALLGRSPQSEVLVEEASGKTHLYRTPSEAPPDIRRLIEDV